MRSQAEFDIIVYGASGFTGRLVAQYFHRRHGVGGEVKWAIAGRNLDKLAAVAAEIGAPKHLACIAADAGDPRSLAAMARRAKAVLTTVGPYQLNGSSLVATCAKEGTDYLDLCGEPAWMRAMIDAHEQEARQSGARIVFSCGFDSIPSDLGVLFLQEEAKKRFGAPAQRVKGRVRKMKGAMSGGTFASFQATLAAAAKDPATLALLKNAFALTPGFEGPKQPSGMKVEYDETIGAWVAPFMMASINTRNVHRTNALLGHPYGRDFVYDEMTIAGPGERGEAVAKAIAEAGAAAGAADGPKPGEGPSADERDAGYFDFLFVGLAADGRQIRVGVTGDKDPGYGSTSQMISEAALCLIRDCAATPGGIWTPGSAMGLRLVAPLTQRAGLSFSVEG